MPSIELRPFRRSDFARLIGWVSSAELLMQWAGGGFTYPLDEDQLDNYLQMAVDENPGCMIFTAFDVQTGDAVGHIELARIDQVRRSASIARVLVGDPAARGRGTGTQIVHQVLDIAFDQLGLHRVELNVFDFNMPAIHCYSKLGFVKEAHIREAREVGGQYWSLFRMSILEDEWRSQR